MNLVARPLAVTKERPADLSGGRHHGLIVSLSKNLAQNLLNLQIVGQG